MWIICFEKYVNNKLGRGFFSDSLRVFVKIMANFCFDGNFKNEVSLIIFFKTSKMDSSNPIGGAIMKQYSTF